MNKITILSAIFILYACGSETESTNVPIQLAKPPVTVTGISTGEMYQLEEFNAYSKYLKKELIRAPISGYLEGVSINPGDRLRKGQILFRLQTQESKALASAHLKNDTLLNLDETVKVSALKDGIVSSVNYQQGAFVQQGEQLADVIALNSIVFVVNVPFEKAAEISKGLRLKIALPGVQTLKASVGEQLPVANTSVQSYILRPDSAFLIPENLNALVQVKTNKKENVQRLNKQAVLTNETQTAWWVMQLINDTTAIKVDINKGLEADSMVEIISPSFSAEDRILLKGQYGLPDTAYVNVVPR